MSIAVTMPEVAETVVEGTIARWLKQPGDRVELYESVVEIVTDKINLELPSPVAGVITEILVPEGETVTVGTPLALMDAEGEAQEVKAPEKPPEKAPAPSPPEAVTPRKATPPTDRRERRYSPLVQKLAEDRGVDLALVPGTGAGGRITKADVLRYAEEQKAAPVTPGAAPPPGADDEIAVDPVRRAIAQRMLQSAQQIPHAWTMMEADVSGLVARVGSAKEEFRRREGINLTYLPFFIQAVARALRAYPMVNSTWSEEKIVLRRQVNIGIAVARDEGLIVPVVKDADQKNVAALAREVHELAERARQNKLSVQDVQGGTFTVNNTGALGSILSKPIINPPQAAIITSEAVVKRPVVVGDAIAVRSVMNICLSFDHRILDGAAATQFLAEVKAHLEAITPETPIT